MLNSTEQENSLQQEQPEDELKHRIDEMRKKYVGNGMAVGMCAGVTVGMFFISRFNAAAIAVGVLVGGIIGMRVGMAVFKRRK